MKPPRYIVNEQGECVEVVLTIKDFEEILEALKDLDDIRAYDKAVAEGDEFVDFEEAVKEIETAE